MNKARWAVTALWFLIMLVAFALSVLLVSLHLKRRTEPKLDWVVFD